MPEIKSHLGQYFLLLDFFLFSRDSVDSTENISPFRENLNVLRIELTWHMLAMTCIT